MKLLLEIPENRAAFVLELLEQLTYIKTTTVDDDFVPMLSNEEKEAIDVGLKSMEKGDLIAHETALSMLNERHPNNNPTKLNI